MIKCYTHVEDMNQADLLCLLQVMGATPGGSTESKHGYTYSSLA